MNLFIFRTAEPIYFRRKVLLRPQKNVFHKPEIRRRPVSYMQTRS